MAENYQTLLVTKADGITTIAFNRPEKRNAMSPQLHREMFNLLTDLRYDTETRAVIITGNGDNFCAGQDLKQYGLEMESQSQRVRYESWKIAVPIVPVVQPLTSFSSPASS